MDGKCLTPNVIYRADVSNNVNNKTKFYIGICETSFKARYSNHVKSIKHNKYSKETELSKYIWELKERDIIPQIRWSIVKRIKNKVSSKSCQLCLSEKFYIIDNLNDNRMLNKRTEFISKCRHLNKLMLASVKSDTMD